MIVLELMPTGDLDKYLNSLSSSTSKPESLPTTLLNFCRQIGYGMNYLTNKGFVHRDLAARNILLTKDITCKVKNIIFLALINRTGLIFLILHF